MDTPIVTEKRLTSRAEVKWPVVLLTSHGATVAETKNIGASGMRFLCSANGAMLFDVTKCLHK